MLKHIIARDSNFITLISNNREKLSAWTILCAVLTQVTGIFYTQPFSTISGVFYWISLLLLWPDLSSRSVKQTIIISIMALPGLVVGISNYNDSIVQNTLTTNIGIITLLITVGLYSLGTTQKLINKHDDFSSGIKGILLTYANVHFIGAIINYAAVLIFGDRLSRHHALTEQQAIIISRSFASAGFWSPLFVTMAVATSYSPGYEFSEIFLAGLLMAITAFLYTLAGSLANFRQHNFRGLTTSYDTMRLPLSVAVVIGVIIYILPNAKIVNIVIVTALIYGIFMFLFRMPAQTKTYFYQRLPGHANELALFLTAGLLNASLVCIVSEYNLDFIHQNITPLTCTLFIFSAVFLTCIGIHPLISVTVFVSITNVTSETANLLAFSLFTAWAIGSSLGPLSGQNIGISSRYGINNYLLMKHNIFYSITLCLTASIILNYIL